MATILFSVILPGLLLIFGKRSKNVFLGIVVISLFPLNLLIMAVGKGLHYIAVSLSDLCIRLLDAIVANSPTGTIGIIGFAFLLVGFLVELAGVWL